MDGHWVMRLGTQSFKRQLDRIWFVKERETGIKRGDGVCTIFPIRLLGVHHNI